MQPRTRRRGRALNAAADSEMLTAIGTQAALERDETMPLWLQLRQRIEEAIADGDFGEDARLPSEQALSAMFNVSRPVVRSAVAALASEGRLARIPRRGTFVVRSAPQDVDFITSNLSVFDDLGDKGRVVTTQTFRFERAVADDRERHFLALPVGADVVRIGRVYRQDGQAITLTNISLPGHKVPGLETMELENRSIFGTIRTRYGLTVQRSERWFKAAMPTADQAARLGIEPSQPVISIESVAYANDGAPLEYYDAIFNSAAARIHVRADGTAPAMSTSTKV